MIIHLAALTGVRKSIDNPNAVADVMLANKNAKATNILFMF